jgi:hypothetical protein
LLAAYSLVFQNRQTWLLRLSLSALSALSALLGPNAVLKSIDMMLKGIAS